MLLAQTFMATVEDYSAIIVALTALVTLFWKHLGPDARTRNGQVVLAERLARIETKLDLFWKVVEQNIPRLLKRPTHKRMDDLLDKMSMGGLNGDHSEAKELILLLEEDLKQQDSTRVLATTLILARLHQLVENNG